MVQSGSCYHCTLINNKCNSSQNNFVCYPVWLKLFLLESLWLALSVWDVTCVEWEERERDTAAHFSDEANAACVANSPEKAASHARAGTLNYSFCAVARAQAKAAALSWYTAAHNLLLSTGAETRTGFEQPRWLPAGWRTEGWSAGGGSVNSITQFVRGWEGCFKTEGGNESFVSAGCSLLEWNGFVGIGRWVKS